MLSHVCNTYDNIYHVIYKHLPEDQNKKKREMKKKKRCNYTIKVK